MKETYHNHFRKALILGILSSMFFAFTFILNRSMNLGGGYWMWNAPLRYLFTIPILAVILTVRNRGKERVASPTGMAETSILAVNDRGIVPVLKAIKAQPIQWFLWSTVGFGFFYLNVTLASTFGESWMTAASWELTIVAGVLLTPLFGKPIPMRNLMLSGLIVAGVFLMQVPSMQSANLANTLLTLIPILIAAFAYPLGNRKMMQYCPAGMDSMQRIFGMALCVMPFYIMVAVIALITGGLPSGSQLIQSVGVALFSGVIGTVLFFGATDLVKEQPKELAVIEATQCGEVVFTLLGGILILHDSMPDGWGLAGMALILVGMVLNSLSTGN